jgi:CRISPR-associated protein Cas1
MLRGELDEVRPFVPARDDRIPLHVVTHGTSLGIDHEEVVVRERGKEIGRVRLIETSQVVVRGNASVSTPLLTALAEHQIPLAVHSWGGWYVGSFLPAGGFAAGLRVAQHRWAADAEASLGVARVLVHGKIRNQRTLLRRNGKDVPRAALQSMADAAAEALRAPNAPSLLGLEGSAARTYFENFPRMLRKDLLFDMDGRNRRPPKDPINALLSFGYACLARELTHALAQVGLEPHVGFYHRMRPGRPALALDLMEEFRPLAVDSAVLTAVNTGTLTPDDFQMRTTGVILRDRGKKVFLYTLERRFDELATHPVFGTTLSLRRIFVLQARLLARFLTGEVPSYLPYRTR